MHYVYILKSLKNGQLYKGSTSNLKRRFEEHNSGQSFSTKPYLPWKLVFYAAFETQCLAEDFERYIKAGSGWAFASKRFLNSSTLRSVMVPCPSSLQSVSPDHQTVRCRCIFGRGFRRGFRF